MYGILVIPLSVVRWIQFDLEAEGRTMSTAAQLFVKAWWNSIGLVDVIVFFKTRSGLLLFDEADGDEADGDDA